MRNMMLVIVPTATPAVLVALALMPTISPARSVATATSIAAPGRLPPIMISARRSSA